MVLKLGELVRIVWRRRPQSSFHGDSLDMRCLKWPAVLLPWLLGGPCLAAGHGLNASYSEINIGRERLTVAFLISVDEIAAHFPPDAGGEAQPQRVKAALPVVSAFLVRHLTITADGETIGLEHGVQRPHGNGSLLRFEFGLRLAGPPASLTIAGDSVLFDRLGPQHVHFVTLSVEGHRQHAIVSINQPRAAFATGYRQGFWRHRTFVWLGIGHIFLGFDHLLFLFALLIVGGAPAQLVKIVTAFTVAHSLTLALAAFQVIVLPPRLVEGSIALSVAYVAFDNLVTPAGRPRWPLTFCFGLVHGLGFANVLGEMNLVRSELVPTLLAFNVGVELGQLAFAAALYPLARWLSDRPYRRAAVVVTSGVIFVVGMGWFVQRAFGPSFMRW